MITQLSIAGYILILLASVHIIFPWYFKWRINLKSLSIINRQMMQVHTLFIALTVFLMGLLCVCCTTDLITTPLGKNICKGLSIFWGIRLAIQLFGYSTKLWRGKVFETIVHIIFTMYWAYLTWLFAVIGFG